MIYFSLDGNFSKNVANAIVSATNGKTFMNFNVEACGYAGNYNICVSTDYDTTPEEAKNFFIFAAFNNIILGD